MLGLQASEGLSNSRVMIPKRQEDPPGNHLMVPTTCTSAQKKVRGTGDIKAQPSILRSEKEQVPGQQSLASLEAAPR